MAGWKPYECDLATEIEALTSRRSEVVDAIAWLAIWVAMLLTGLFAR